MIELIQKIEFVGLFSLLVVGFLLSILWNVHFYQIIILYSRKRRECLEMGERDYVEYYRIDIINKYALMLAINITEFRLNVDLCNRNVISFS